MRTSLIIPIYNESGRLQPLLKKTAHYFSPADTIIVDDGSEDGCTDDLEDEGYATVRHSRNRGKGCALQSGFRRSIDMGYDWTLTMDADGQHDPSCIPAFIAEAEEGRFGIIIGNRRKNLSGMPLDRKFSNLSTSFILSIVTGRKIWDGQCGYRMYRMDFLRSIRLKTSSYEAETELLLKAVDKNLKIGWIDIPTIYSDEKSHIRRGMDTFKFLKLVTGYLLRIHN